MVNPNQKKALKTQEEFENVMKTVKDRTIILVLDKVNRVENSVRKERDQDHFSEITTRASSIEKKKDDVMPEEGICYEILNSRNLQPLVELNLAELTTFDYEPSLSIIDDVLPKLKSRIIKFENGDLYEGTVDKDNR